MLLIRNRWYAVLASRDVPRRRPVAFERLGERLAFWRDRSGRIACVADRCPHRGASLGRGRLEGDCIACPFHGFRFAADGTCTLVPAIGARPVPRHLAARSLPVREAHGFVWLWWGDVVERLPELPWFDDVDDAEFSIVGYSNAWQAHHTRVIEGQLDVAHLPFVHRRSIGRDGRTVVDGPYTELDGDVISVWVSNRHDDGRPALRPGELARPAAPPLLQFRFPNLWRLRVRDATRLVVAVAPVNDETTALYIQFCQRFVRVPVLRSLVNGLQVLWGKRIGAEDRRVIPFQQPPRTDGRLQEHLIAADHPIALYRHRRDELLRAERGPSVHRRRGTGVRPERPGLAPGLGNTGWGLD